MPSSFVKQRNLLFKTNKCPENLREYHPCGQLPRMECHIRHICPERLSFKKENGTGLAEFCCTSRPEPTGGRGSRSCRLCPGLFCVCMVTVTWRRCLASPFKQCVCEGLPAVCRALIPRFPFKEVQPAAPAPLGVRPCQSHGLGSPTGLRRALCQVYCSPASVLNKGPGFSFGHPPIPQLFQQHGTPVEPSVGARPPLGWPATHILPQ